MKVILPKFIKYSINDVGNKTKKESALKIYAALYKKEKRKNINGYFPVPSTYLESINKRYYTIIDKFIEDGIIEVYKRKIQDPNDLFNHIEKKYYNKTLGICMKYKFLVDISKGEEIDVEMMTTKNKKWYEITKNSLTQLGYNDIKISRDGFGRRVHHNLTQIYKEELKDRGLCVIDAKCSQPRLLYLLMKERGVVDPVYYNIFETGKDFYLYLLEELDLFDRKAAKDLFMYFLNSDGYVPNSKIHNLFKVTSQFVKTLKNNHYKDSSSFMQREEARIWIDDLLENLPVAFGLTIHDSLIVKDRDVMRVLKYCKERQPQIEFEVKEL